MTLTLNTNTLFRNLMQNSRKISCVALLFKRLRTVSCVTPITVLPYDPFPLIRGRKRGNDEATPHRSILMPALRGNAVPRSLRVMGGVGSPGAGSEGV